MHRPAGAPTIGAVARAVGVNVETVRFYQRKGLLRVPPRPPGGTRRYAPQDVARLKFIKSAQRLGFSLAEVAQLLRLEDGTQCGTAAALAAQHLDDVRQRLRDLRRIEATLCELLERCDREREEVTCPLIAALHSEESETD